MWKKAFARIPLGFASTVFVVALIQICIAQNGGSTVTERFASFFAVKDAAVLTQLLLAGAIGAAFSGASVVYDLERWSFLRQGIVYFVITAAVWVPVLLICWTPMPKEGILFSSLGWTGTYAITWGIQYAVYRNRIRDLNRKIHERNKAE